jgi:hypothetical protein
MSCEEIKNRILEYQENPLPSAQRRDMEAHLAGCDGCRTFARQLRQLDAALSAGIHAPALSADFDHRLQERIQFGPAALSETERAARKRQLQAEFEAGRVRIGRGSLTLETLMNHLAWPALAIVAGCLAWRFTLPLTARLSAQSLGGLDPNLLPWLAASAVFLAISLPEAFPRQWRSLRFW